MRILCTFLVMLSAVPALAQSAGPFAEFARHAESAGCTTTVPRNNSMDVRCDTVEQWRSIQQRVGTSHGLTTYGPTREGGKLVYIVMRR